MWLLPFSLGCILLMNDDISVLNNFPTGKASVQERKVNYTAVKAMFGITGMPVC